MKLFKGSNIAEFICGRKIVFRGRCGGGGVNKKNKRLKHKNAHGKLQPARNIGKSHGGKKL